MEVSMKQAVGHTKNIYCSKLDSFVLHVVDECNLRCWGCDHFAPLAKGGYIDPVSLERDLKRIAELTNQDLRAVCLMGGEPLLHPELPKLLQISRDCLPYTEIVVMTNGILLNKQEAGFWQACHDNSIKIINTRYPIKLDYGKMENKAKDYGVDFICYGGESNIHTTSYHIPLHLTPVTSAEGIKNWQMCFHANRFRMLKDGKLYPCTIAPNIIHFNNFFGKNVPLSEKDGVDIYKAKNLQEILDFLSKPIPCCRNCNVQGRSFDHPWRCSARNILEWSR